MAVADLYLLLTSQDKSPVKGEVKTKNFENQIELTDWKWSLTVEGGGLDAQKGQTHGRPEPTVLEFSKPLDRSSTVLMKALRTSYVFPEAKISLVHNIAEGMSVFVTLQQVRVIDYKMSIRSGDKTVEMEEEWIVDYEKVKIEYSAREDANMVVRTKNFFASKAPTATANRPAKKDDELAERILELRNKGDFEGAAKLAGRK
jgi:type VI secretion system Hcp family effector